MAQDKIDREKEIEKLAEETGRRIREADPETQQELREAASAMMREESSATSSTEATQRRRRRPMNPLAFGILLLVVGVGFFLFFPPIGLFMIVVGLIGVVWGFLRTLLAGKKTQ